jgi:cytochrome c5
MSEVHVEEHSTPIQTPQQLIIVVLLAFLVPILLIIMVTQLVTGGMKIDRDSALMSDAAVAKRLKPVGEVFIGEPPPAESSPTGAAPPPAPASANSVAAKGGKVDGSKVYQTVCAMCHGTGLAGAPKLGDKAAWKARIGQGAATLHEHAIKGIRAMPAKGGNPALSDAEVSAAVDYMVGQAK